MRCNAVVHEYARLNRMFWVLYVVTKLVVEWMFILCELDSFFCRSVDVIDAVRQVKLDVVSRLVIFKMVFE